MNAWLMISVVLASGIAHLLIRPFLFIKLRNHSGKTKRGTVTDEAELLHFGHDSQTEKKKICETDNLVTSTRLSTDGNHA